MKYIISLLFISFFCTHIIHASLHNLIHPSDWWYNLLSSEVKDVIERASIAEDNDENLSLFAHELSNALEHNSESVQNSFFSYFYTQDIEKGSLLLRIYHHCMQHNNPKMCHVLLRVALDRGANPNSYGRKNINIAFKLLDTDDVDMLNLLQEYTDFLSAKDENGYHILQAAVLNQKPKITYQLLQSLEWQSYVNAPTPDNKSLLGITIANANVQMAQTLLQYQANPNLIYGDSQIPLIEAVKYAQEQMVDLLLSWGATVNIRDSNKNSPLLHAAKLGNDRIMMTLIKKGAYINIMNDDYESPFLLTIDRICKISSIDDRKNVRATIEYMLQQGADINTKDSRQETALIKVCDSELSDLIDLIFSYAPDVNQKDLQQNTSLNRMITKGNRKVVQQLIAHRATTHHVNRTGETPLFQAIKEGQFQMIDLLLDEAGNNSKFIDPRGNTLWHIYAQNPHHKTLPKKLVQQAQSLINTKNNNGDTPLHIAVTKGNGNLVQILLDAGAKIDALNAKHQTVLHLATQKSYAVLKMFLEKDTMIQLINAQDNDGNTAIHHAVAIGDVKCLKLLLDKQAMADIKNNNGQTPFLLACKNRQLESIRILMLSKRVNPNRSDNQGYAGIHEITKAGHIVEFLALVRLCKDQVFVDINKQTKAEKQTALHIATIRQDIASIDSLIAAEANVNIGDKDGHTPLYYAFNSADPITYTKRLFQHEYIEPDYLKPDMPSLHAAYDKEDFELLALFLSHQRIALDAKNAQDKTIWDRALETNQTQKMLNILYTVRDSGEIKWLHRERIKNKIKELEELNKLKNPPPMNPEYTQNQIITPVYAPSLLPQEPYIQPSAPPAEEETDQKIPPPVNPEWDGKEYHDK